MECRRTAAVNRLRRGMMNEGEYERGKISGDREN